MPSDNADEDSIRNRLFELMPKYPSKDACKMHLRREGFASDVVERVVDETFAIRKKVVMRRMTNEDQLTRILVSILDGEEQMPQDAEQLHPVAREYSKRMARDARTLNVVLRGYLGVAILLVLVVAIWPSVLLVFVAVGGRRPWVWVAMLGGILGAVGNAISSHRQLNRINERSAALKNLASERNWRDLAV